MPVAKRSSAQQAAPSNSSNNAQGGAAAGDGGAAKKKHRPPPLQMTDTSIGVLPPPTFSLPSIRGPPPTFSTPIYSQQSMSVPAAAPWEVTEQVELERLNRTICYPGESLFSRSIKIAAHLRSKTVREVACKLKLMETEDAAQPRAPSNTNDGIDQLLGKNDEILSELRKLPLQGRSEIDNNRLRELAGEFVCTSKDLRTRLDQKQFKLPVQAVQVPAESDLFRSS